jgi:hypothetical protein
MTWPPTSQLFANACERYQHMVDESWRLTDCASFVIMEQQRLTTALSYDRHFIQARFQALLRLVWTPIMSGKLVLY